MNFVIFQHITVILRKVLTQLVVSVLINIKKVIAISKICEFYLNHKVFHKNILNIDMKTKRDQGKVEVQFSSFFLQRIKQ